MYSTGSSIRQGPTRLGSLTFRTSEHAAAWLYLAVVLDLFARKVVGWAMSPDMPATLVCQALQLAIVQRRPAPGLIVHSDRGSQYASALHQKLLTQHGLVGSMSRNENCRGNAVVDRFFLNLKMERLWQRDYANHAEAMRDIADYTRQLLQQRVSALHTGQLASQCLRAAIGNQTTYRRVQNNLTRTLVAGRAGAPSRVAVCTQTVQAWARKTGRFLDTRDCPHCNRNDAAQAVCVNKENTMGRVANKVALVTGAASGIGAASACMLAGEGATVVLADLDAAAGERVLRDIEAAGGTGMSVKLDVALEQDWISVMAMVRQRFGRLDIAVNCAGVNIARSFPTDTTLEDWRRLMSINLDGVFLGTKHSLAAMEQSDPVSGSIINISSIMGMIGAPDIAAYNASKGGVRLYSKSVALSCAKKRLAVRVNTIHPGFIDTPLLREAIDRFEDRAEGQRFYDALAPVGRLGTPDDIAYGVLYLASDESKFVTGSELVIDGGYTAR